MMPLVFGFANENIGIGVVLLVLVAHGIATVRTPSRTHPYVRLGLVTGTWLGVATYWDVVDLPEDIRTAGAVIALIGFGALIIIEIAEHTMWESSSTE